MSVSSNAPDGAADAVDGTGDGQLSKDVVFHVLQNERRRRVLEYLSRQDGAVNMRDLAEQVAAWEHDTTVRQLTSDERQRVYIALYQSHLPKLDDVGIIDYNQSRGVVERTPLADRVEAYLDVTDGDRRREDDTAGADGRRWSRYSAAATVAGAVLTALAWAAVVPATVAAGAVTALVGGLTVLLAAAERDRP